MNDAKALVLVKLDTSWADEFDPQGFEIMTQSEWDEYLAGVDKMRWPLEQYYGTNEYYTIDSKEDFLQAVTAHPLTEQEAALFKRLFTTYAKVSFGFSIPDIFGIIEEMEWDAQAAANDK